MAPHPDRTLTGDTYMNDKTPHTPVSPTNTETTLTVDTDVVSGHDCCSPTRRSTSAVDVESALPHSETKERPKLLQRFTEPFRSIPDPPRVTENRTRTLEETPAGFPKLAAFQSSDANFSLYRSFNYLHSRVLLDLQDEITTLEKELDEIDEIDYEIDPARLQSREIDIDIAIDEQGTRNRRVILREIKEKLKEYDEIMIRARTLESFQKPSDRNYRTVRRYHNNTSPLLDSEMDSIRTKEDIVSLTNGREWATFDGSVETMLGWTDRLLHKVFRLKNPPLQKYFRSPELRAKTNDEFINFYSSDRIDKLVNILITFVIFCLLVVPVITMYKLTSTATHESEDTSNSDSSTSAKGSSSSTLSIASSSSRDTINAVGVLIVFTLLFSAAMSLLTRAARHELFAASAAYCAILVVFIGNFTGPGN